MSRQPLISINIPCYNQLPYARRVVSVVLEQPIHDFELTLLDDGASDEYRAYVDSLRDARVRYHRNPARLGAMRNMFAAIKGGRGKYTFAFHEDDLFDKHYLETAVNILEDHPRYGFVVGELREFRTDPPAPELSPPWGGHRYDEIADRAEYLRRIFRGIEPMFGSVVYRHHAIEAVEPEHERYATLVDRPFLLAVLEGWSAAIVRAPMVWYRHHPEGDARHREMRVEHILALFETYRGAWPETWSDADAELFYRYSRSWLVELYRLTAPDDRPLLARFAYEAWKRGVYRPALRGPLGVRAITRDALARFGGRPAIAAASLFA